MQGYAGVMMGMRWVRSRGFSRGSHTGMVREVSRSMARSMMGVGQAHWLYTCGTEHGQEGARELSTGECCGSGCARRVAGASPHTEPVLSTQHHLA
jgi:hypothetical protein